MSKRMSNPSAIEIIFAPTRDGLVLDKIILRPSNTDAEKDLRRFLQRFRDPDVDLDARAIQGASS